MNQQIAVAVKWWGDQLRGKAKQDNGDAMTGVLVRLLDTQPEDPTKVDVFEQTLAHILPDRLSSSWDEKSPRWGTYGRVLDCDYAAGPCLREAAEAAGIEPMCPPFPMKTTMWIDPDRVMVRLGYYGEQVIIWSP